MEIAHSQRICDSPEVKMIQTQEEDDLNPYDIPAQIGTRMQVKQSPLQKMSNKPSMLSSPFSHSSSRISSQQPYSSAISLPKSLQTTPKSEKKFVKEFDKNAKLSKGLMEQAKAVCKKQLNTVAINEESPLKYLRPIEDFDNPATFNKRRSISSTKNKKLSKSAIISPKTTNKSQVNDTVDRSFHSNAIIANVFDGNFSAATPSQKKLNETNLLNTQHMENQNKKENTLVEKFADIAKTFASNYSLESAFEAVCHNLANDISEQSIDSLFAYFAECQSSERKDIRLGGIVGFYHLTKIYTPNSTLLSGVVDSVIGQLTNYEAQDANYLVCAIELLASIMKRDPSQRILFTLKTLLCAFPQYDLLIATIVNTLIQFGAPGLELLVYIANKDYHGLQLQILQKLAQLHFIQREIIVPSIINDLTSNDTFKRHSALAALNRCYGLVYESGGIRNLTGMLEEGSAERQLISCAIRASGNEGEQLLVKILKYHQNTKIRIAAASVLGLRLPVKPTIIKFQVTNNEILQLAEKMPCNMCMYVGEIKSLLEANEEDNEKYIVEINPRDFLASIQRFLFNSNRINEIQISESDSYSLLLDSFNIAITTVKYPPSMFPVEHKEEAFPTIQYESVPAYVIKALSQALKDSSSGVREICASTLGSIGLSEAVDAYSPIIDACEDKDPNVRAMAVWALGRIAPDLGNKAVKPLVNRLHDSYWKVRTAACIAISSLTPNISSQALPHLLKLLKDGSVNKQLVAESIVKIGPAGMYMMVDIIRKQNSFDYKTREYFAKSLALSNCEDPSIDQAIEVLFIMSKEQSAALRKSCLISLDMLRQKANEGVPYLKARNLLPFLYKFLGDPSDDVRMCAVVCIKHFGPQGELLFIEGLTKDKNPRIRKHCAIGLGQIGATTFRTLLLGFHDCDSAVREAVASAISENMTVQSILDTYKAKPYQKQAIKCTLKEILSQTSFVNRENTRQLLSTLYSVLNTEVVTDKFISDTHPKPSPYKSGELY